MIWGSRVGLPDEKCFQRGGMNVNEAVQKVRQYVDQHRTAIMAIEAGL